jgi:hypothetical protein
MEGDRADKKKLNHASFSYNVYCCIFKTSRLQACPIAGAGGLKATTEEI